VRRGALLGREWVSIAALICGGVADVGSWIGWQIMWIASAWLEAYEHNLPGLGGKSRAYRE